MAVALQTFLTISNFIGDELKYATNTSNSSSYSCTESAQQDAQLTFIEIAAKYGYPAEQFEVITEDGYKLTVFHIPGKRKALPILLFHGVLDSCDTWIIRGEESMSITLAKQGYDIWLGNTRGTRYSRGHVVYNADVDPAYWNFTFNEHGQYDLSATIDLVLNKTNATKLNAFGHSQGTAIYWVLCSTRPEYNDKINVMTALAPIAYLQNTPPPVSTLIAFAPLIYLVGRFLNVHEVLAENSIVIQSLRTICPVPGIGYGLCAVGIFSPASGYDLEEFEECFLRILIKHYPQPTSLKNLYHFAQVGFSKSFAQFDYGEDQNRIAYNSTTPPKYDLSKMSTRVVLLVGMNDHLSTIADVELLRRQLPNVVSYRVIPRVQCNHFDFVTGKQMATYLYPEIFDILKRYEN